MSIFFLIFVLLFQNCSDIGVIKLVGSSSQSSKSEPETDSGNATGYDGKLDGVFFHYIPGYKCENHESAFSKIDYKPMSVNSTYTISKESQCLSAAVSVPTASLDTGALQNKVIGYEEKIFEYTKSGSANAVKKMVEIWCVDQWNSSKVEIVSYYDLSNSQAQTEFYYPSIAKRTEANPARSVGIETVRLNSNYFELIVDKRQRGSNPGTFKGELKISGSAADRVAQTLQCRLGGTLDARLWPAKAVNYDSFVQAEWNFLGKVFYISSGLSPLGSTAENRFFSYSPLADTKKTIVGNVTAAVGVNSFQFLPDQSAVILKAQLTGDKALQLYLKSLGDSNSPIMLNQKLVDRGQGIDGEITVTPDSRFVYYQDGSQETSGDIETWLRVVDTKTGAISQVNHDIGLATDEAVRQYEVSQSLGKVLYSIGFINTELWIANLDGGNRHKLDLSAALGVNTASPYGGTKYYLEWYIKQSSRWILSEDRFLTIIPASSLSTASRLILVIDLQTEKVIASHEIDNYATLFPVSGLPVVGVKKYGSIGSAPALSYLDLKSMQIKTVADVINTYKTSTNFQIKDAALTLEVSQMDNLCEMPGESTLYKVRINSSRKVQTYTQYSGSADSPIWLVINKSSNGIASVYVKTLSGSNCQGVNKIKLSATEETYLSSLRSAMPSTTNSDPLNTRMSEDSKNIIISLQSRLYLIPTDQRPVIEVYTALNDSPTFEDIGFVDNSTIYFQGALIKDFWNQVFVWIIPKY